MPYYDYHCATCGRFEMRRPLQDSALPAPCPTCSTPAPRALSAPAIGSGKRDGGGHGGGGGGCGSGSCGHVH